MYISYWSGLEHRWPFKSLSWLWLEQLCEIKHNEGLRAAIQCWIQSDRLHLHCTDVPYSHTHTRTFRYTTHTLKDFSREPSLTQMESLTLEPWVWWEKQHHWPKHWRPPNGTRVWERAPGRSTHLTRIIQCKCEFLSLRN